MNPAARCDDGTAPRWHRSNQKRHLVSAMSRRPTLTRQLVSAPVWCVASSESFRVHGSYGPTEVALIPVSVPGTR